MKKLIVLSVVLLVLGSVSWGWAGIYSYDVEQVNSQDMYGVFNNDSDSDATVALTLYYGENYGGNPANYYYSVNGASWIMIENSGDGQDPDGSDGPGQFWAYDGVIAANGSFRLKFASGGTLTDQDLSTSNTDGAPYWFAFNSGVYNGTHSTGCVAIIEGSPTVPIPGAIWLLGSGLGALMVTRRKRKA